MSRIFDALRWAEGQRRKTTSRIADALAEGPSESVSNESEMRSSELSEGFVRELGILRNSVDSLFKGRDKRTLLFTSATPGEGTTTIAVSFAKFLAMRGEDRILLCELNARRPAFTRVFSINGDVGATDFFDAGADLTSLVQSLGDRELDVLHVGRHDPSVIQLNVNEAFPRLLEEAARDYNTVIVDAPPVISCPETLPMASFVDGVVVIVEAGRTKREIVVRSIESIEKFRGNILGVVLNRKKYYIPEFLYKRI